MHIKKEKIHNYNLTIVLPHGYDSSKKYPTIYLQDGGNGAIQSLNYIEHLIITQQITPFILVGIEPIDRNNDYTPWPSSPLIADKPRLGGQAKEYLTILTSEIKPFIDHHFATDPRPKATTIGGCSFGGLVTVFASYYFPEIFGNYISLSASFWVEDVVPYLQGQLLLRDGISFKKPTVYRKNHKFYGYVGELEGIYRDSIQQQMLSLTKQSYAHLFNEGFLKENFLFELNKEGTHDTLFFSQYFLRAITWLFPIDPIN